MPARRRKGKDPDDDYPPDEVPEDVEAFRVHEAYLEHRLGGGEEADPQAYLRAVEQFERLPGAMRTAPTASRPAQPTAAPEDKEAAEAQAADRNENGPGS